MNYSTAKRLADALEAAMAPYCLCIQIAGSIRRQKAEGIKDIEIVAQPLWGEIPDPTDLFGESSQLINHLYDWAMGQHGPCPVQWIKPGTTEAIPWYPNKLGKYWRGMTRGGVKLDLFLVTPASRWPVYLIRTGSAAFSEAMMVEARRSGYRFQDGLFQRVHGDTLAPINTLESERAIFDLIGVKYVPPEERTGPEAITRTRRWLK